MSQKAREKTVLKQETKSDIQELFDELFVGKLNEKISNISELTDDNVDELKEIKNTLKRNNSCIAGGIDYLEELKATIGTVDDWNGDTLISFLNQLSDNLNKCKCMLDKQKEYISNYRKNIQDFKENFLKNEFDMITKKLNCFEDVINTLEKMKEDLQIVKSEFKEDGFIKKINDLQQPILDKMVLSEENMDSIIKKLDLIILSIDKTSNLLYEELTFIKSDLATMNNSFLKNNKRIFDEINNLQLLIQSHEEKFFKNEFGMITQKLNCVEDIINTLEQVKGDLKFVKSEFEEDGFTKKVINLRQPILDKITLNEESIDEICNKFDLTNSFIEKESGILTEEAAFIKSDLKILNNVLSVNNDTMLKKMEDIVRTGKQRFMFASIGMGALIISNIVMLIMLMIK